MNKKLATAAVSCLILLAGCSSAPAEPADQNASPAVTENTAEAEKFDIKKALEADGFKLEDVKEEDGKETFTAVKGNYANPVTNWVFADGDVARNEFNKMTDEISGLDKQYDFQVSESSVDYTFELLYDEMNDLYAYAVLDVPSKTNVLIEDITSKELPLIKKILKIDGEAYADVEDDGKDAQAVKKISSAQDLFAKDGFEVSDVKTSGDKTTFKATKDGQTINVEAVKCESRSEAEKLADKKVAAAEDSGAWVYLEASKTNGKSVTYKNRSNDTYGFVICGFDNSMVYDITSVTSGYKSDIDDMTEGLLKLK